MLGSKVKVDDPVTRATSNLQCRRITITVKHQHATVTYELYDPNTPLDITTSIPSLTKQIHEVKTNDKEDEVHTNSTD